MNTHFFPGRVRLHFIQLRQTPGRLAMVCADLGGVSGVTSIHSSALTGGILIRFAPAAGAMARFWDELETVLLAHHLHPSPRGSTRVASIPAPPKGVSATTPLCLWSVCAGVAGPLFARIATRFALALVVAML